MSLIKVDIFDDYYNDLLDDITSEGKRRQFIDDGILTAATNKGQKISVTFENRATNTVFGDFVAKG